MPSRPRPLRVLLSHVKGTPPETLLVVEVIPLSILALTDGTPHWRSRMERLTGAHGWSASPLRVAPTIR